MSDLDGVLAFAPKSNTPGKRDATGAFQPKARRFVELHGGRVVRIDQTRSKAHQRAAILDAIRQQRPTKGVAFFCHGTKGSIQLGGWHRPDALASALLESCRPGVIFLGASQMGARVPLYACDAARDDDADRRDDLVPGSAGAGGFASRLAEAFARVSVGPTMGWIDAHVTVGHTTTNPYVRRFPIREKSEGEWIVGPHEGAFWRTWRRLLRTTDLDLRFPAMLRRDIRQLVIDATR